MPRGKFSRVLLKISGRAFGDSSIDVGKVKNLAKLISDTLKSQPGPVELAIVVGGGNIIRGCDFGTDDKVTRVTLDYIGMLVTAVNALAIQLELKTLGRETRVMTNIKMDRIAEEFILGRAEKHLKKGRIIIIACGLGQPLLNTDYVSVQIAVQIGAEIVLKGTDVDGVYECDPRHFPNAKFLSHVSYDEYLANPDRYRVMHRMAIDLAAEVSMPVRIFNFSDKSNFGKILAGESIGSLIDKSSQPLA